MTGMIGHREGELAWDGAAITETAAAQVHWPIPRGRFGCQNALPLSPPGCAPLSGTSTVFQSIAPVFTSSATSLPRKLHTDMPDRVPEFLHSTKDPCKQRRRR